MIVSIPVRPFVKKIILIEEGEEPIKVRLDTLLGRLIYSSVGKQAISIKMKEEYSEVLEFDLPRKISDYSFNRVKLALINETYYQRFKDIMFVYFRAQTKAGLTLREAIDNFFEDYQIGEDEYNRETARREWNRYLNKKSIK